MNKLKKIKDFNAAAKTYEKNAKMQCMIAEDLIDRLKYIKIDPHRVLDIGSATGILGRKLKKIYPKVKIFELDYAIEMQRESKKKLPLKSLFIKNNLYVNGDMDYLPFEKNSFDLIISSSSIQWSSNVQKLFKDIYSILKDDGVFMFSTYLNETLKELQSFKKIKLTQDFFNIQEYAKFLLSENFYDPVLIRDEYKMQYSNSISVLKDLKALGVSKGTETHKGLKGKKFLKELLVHLDGYKLDGKNQLTYEVLFAHAWKIKKINTDVVNFIKK
jgi:malonyl-CoA O-methyltransferase